MYFGTIIHVGMQSKESPSLSSVQCLLALAVIMVLYMCLFTLGNLCYEIKLFIFNLKQIFNNKKFSIDKDESSTYSHAYIINSIIPVNSEFSKL